MELKLGDRVRSIIELSFLGKKSLPIGTIGTITDIDEEKTTPYLVTSDHGEWWWYEAKHLEKVEWKEDTTIKDSGDRTTFETGAVRDMHIGKGRMDLLPFHAILELSKHCENGAIKYEEHNVEKGIPQHSLIDSGMRHLFKYAAGYTDEDHLLAALWNIAWAVNQRETHPELIDVPWKGEENDRSRND